MTETFKVAASQPAFLPWSGFWGKAMAVDAMILMVGSGWSSAEYFHRTRIGDAWVSLDKVPSKTTPKILSDVKVTKRSVKKAWTTLKQHVFSARNRNWQVSEYLEPVFTFYMERDEIPLEEFNLALIYALQGAMKWYGFQTGVFVESVYGKDLEASTTRKLFQFLEKTFPGVENMRYYSGAGAFNYWDPKSVPPNIEVVFQGWETPISGNSLVQLIAEEADYPTTIISAQEWLKYDEHPRKGPAMGPDLRPQG